MLKNKDLALGLPLQEFEKKFGNPLGRKLFRRFRGKLPPDLTDPEVCAKFAVEYGKAIGPKLRAIDQWQARSLGRAHTTVVRGPLLETAAR